MKRIFFIALCFQISIPMAQAGEGIQAEPVADWGVGQVITDLGSAALGFALCSRLAGQGASSRLKAGSGLGCAVIAGVIGDYAYRKLSKPDQDRFTNSMGECLDTGRKSEYLFEGEAHDSWCVPRESIHRESGAQCRIVRNFVVIHGTNVSDIYDEETQEQLPFREEAFFRTPEGGWQRTSVRSCSGAVIARPLPPPLSPTVPYAFLERNYSELLSEPGWFGSSERTRLQTARRLAEDLQRRNQMLDRRDYNTIIRTFGDTRDRAAARKVLRSVTE